MMDLYKNPMSIFPVLLLIGTAAGCAQDFSSQEWGSGTSPDQAMIDTQAGWEERPMKKSDCPEATPSALPLPSGSPSPAASPSPSPILSPSPSPSEVREAAPNQRPEHRKLCRYFPWWGKCRARLRTMTETTDCPPEHLSDQPPAVAVAPQFHNTRFCRVDSEGNIIASDQSQVFQEGEVVHGVSGGCIARPIREVWAIFLNDAVMKPDDVSEYIRIPRLDLIPQDPSSRYVFIFDFRNIYHALGGLVNPEWVVRWYHAIPYGTYEAPNQIAINFQKVDGTRHIRLLRGGYVLDRTSETVTSYGMEQWADADRYDLEKASSDMSRNFERLRAGAPAWESLPVGVPIPFERR